MAFPDAIDNTIRSSAATCLTQAKYAYIENLSGPGESVHLLYGAAIAVGLETTRRAFFDEGLSHDAAVEKGAQAAWDHYGDFDPPHRSPKTRASVREGIHYYFSIWPMTSDPVQPMRLNDGRLGVEWRFKVPIPDLIHPDHGGPIYYVGRSDVLGTLRPYGGMIQDDKTATQLGEKWANQFTLDSQGIGYHWAAQQPEATPWGPLLPPGAPGVVLFRGLGVYTSKYSKPGSDSPAKKYDQADIDAGRVIYRRDLSFGHSQAIVNITPWIVERWLRQLKRDIARLIYAYENDEWDLALTKQACAAYNGCAFTDLCTSQNPDQWKAINFVQRKWDPLADV